MGSCAKTEVFAKLNSNLHLLIATPAKVYLFAKQNYLSIHFVTKPPFLAFDERCGPPKWHHKKFNKRAIFTFQMGWKNLRKTTAGEMFNLFLEEGSISKPEPCLNSTAKKG